MSKSRWSVAEGMALVEQWRNSGIGKKEFCAAYGIGYQRLLYWCKLAKNKLPVGETPAGLVRLDVVQDTAEQQIEIRGTNGLVLFINAGNVSADFIKQLLTA
jgi:transposase-like protein